jgi:ubiquinone/menaquinone biosynthesis C-methylase UbiE
MNVSHLNQKSDDVKLRVLLNLGCGQNRPSGWVNTDSSLNSLLQKLPLFHNIAIQLLKSVEYSSNAEYMDLRKPWRFSDNSVDVVYASHLFEHLSLSYAQQFLTKSYRVLKSGGVIRLVVPDLYQLAQIYIDSYKSKDTRAASNFLYWTNLFQENTYPDHLSPIVKAINLWQDYPHQHKYMYDFLSLEKTLLQAGFVDLQESSCAQSQYIPEIKQVEHNSEGVASIYLEARKP